MLESEIKTFELNRKELVGRALGKFALIKGERIVGTYDTANDAVRAGYAELGNVEFLVEEISQFDSPLSFTSNLLAV